MRRAMESEGLPSAEGSRARRVCVGSGRSPARRHADPTEFRRDHRPSGGDLGAGRRRGLRAVRGWVLADLQADRDHPLRLRRPGRARDLCHAARPGRHLAGEPVGRARAAVSVRDPSRARCLRARRGGNLCRARPALREPRLDDRLGCRDRSRRVRDPCRDRRHLPALELRLPGPAALPPRRHGGVHPPRRSTGAGARVLRRRAGHRARPRLGLVPGAHALRARAARGGRRPRGRACRRGPGRVARHARLCARRGDCDAGRGGRCTRRGGQREHRHAARPEGARGGAGGPLRAAAVGLRGGPSARRRRGGDRERAHRWLAARTVLPRGAAARLRAAADLAVAVARGARGTGVSVLEQTAVELRRAAGEARARWSTPAWLALAALGIAAAIPFLSLPGVRVDALADTTYLALAATALGLIVGPAGLPSLGTGAFMAIGAFTSALLVARSGWALEPAVLAGTAAALVAGLLCGAVVRLRREFVAVSTWLLAWLVWLFLLAFPSISGGSQGLILPPRSLLGLDA